MGLDNFVLGESVKYRNDIGIIICFVNKCPGCGANVHEEQLYCTNCYTNLDLDNMYCWVCFDKFLGLKKLSLSELSKNDI